MERLRHHLLAGAAFAENQHRRGGRRHLADEGEDGLHRRARAQHVLEHLGPLPLLHGAIFLLELGHVDASLQHELELVHLAPACRGNRRPGADGAQRVLLVALAGDDDHLGQRIQREQRRERRQTFLRIVGTRREAEIEQRDRGAVGGERRHRVRLGRRPSPPRSRLRAPTSSASGCPRRLPRSGASVSSLLVVDRKAGVKRRAFADFALDVHAAAVRLDDGPGLKQADARAPSSSCSETDETGSP